MFAERSNVEGFCVRLCVCVCDWNAVSGRDARQTSLNSR